MILRELLASVGMQVDSAGFAKAESALAAVANGLDALKQLAAGAAVALASAVGATALAADQASQLSQELGLSTTAFQELNFAAQQTGLGTEAMVGGLKHLAHNLQIASLGGEEAVKNFRQLGLAVGYGTKHFESADVWLAKVAEKFAALPADANRAGIATGIFGESGIRLIPLLNKGRAGLDDLRQAAHDYGVVLDDEAIESGKQFNASIRRVTATLQGLAYAIGGPLMGALTPYVEAMAEWLRLNREVIAVPVVETVTRLGTSLKKVLQLFDPYIAGLKWLVSNTFLLKVAAAGLGLVLTAKVGAAIMALGPIISTFATTVSGMASLVAFAAEGMTGLQVAGALAGAVINSTALAAFGLAAAVALALIALEDIWGFFTEDRETFIGTFGQEWTNFLDDLFKLNDYDQDNPLSRYFKVGAAALFDLQGTWEKLKASLGPFLDKAMSALEAFGKFISGHAAELGDSIKEGLLNSIPGLPAVRLAGGLPGTLASGVGDMVSRVAELGPARAVDSYFGSGASPTASVAAAAATNNDNSRSSVTDARTYSATYQITNNGDPEQLKRVLEEHDRQLFGEAHASVQGGGL